MSQKTRALMPDYLRLFALFGIVVVNVQYIAFSALEAEMPTYSTLDDITLFLVDGLATSKSYGLFSFMFGVGLGFLMVSADRAGLPFKQVYRRRMFGLFALGLAHGLLFFVGDILVIYAITGMIFLLFRDWTVPRLVRVGAVLVGLGAVLFALTSLMPETAVPDEFLAFERFALTDGQFGDAVIYRSTGFAITMPFLLFIQGTSALGWFCLGLAALKSGMIDNADHPLWARARRVCLIPGVGLSLVGSAVWHWGDASFGGAVTMLVAPVTTIGYLGLIAAIARPPGPFVARLLHAGGSSLTIYLGQSIILSTLFAGYGFGLWEAVDRASATLIAVGVTVLLITAVSLWRLQFRLGPFEMLLRRMTYRGATAR